MMMFRTIKSWVVDYLASYATARGYRVVGFSDSDIDATQLRGANRLVQVFVKDGSFDKKSGSFIGPVVHDVTMSVQLLTAATAEVDLNVLEDPTATAGERAAALAASQKAAALADDDFDELFEVIYNLLMANDQQDLGHPREVGNRWISGWKKGSPLNRGENVIIPGTIDFSFRVSEDLTGVATTEPTPDGVVRVAINASADEAGTPQEGSAVLAGG